jgi:rhodanese-related sulfurtransferase
VNKKIALMIGVGALAVAGVIALTMMAAPATNKNVGNDELARLQSAGATIVDVRTVQEFDTAHIPSALNVPLEQVKQAAASWNKDLPVVVYCATGARSAEAASILAAAGFRKVYNLEKGIVAWTGDVASGQNAAGASAAGGAVKTGGKPLFIEFSTST